MEESAQVALMLAEESADRREESGLSWKNRDEGGAGTWAAVAT